METLQLILIFALPFTGAYYGHGLAHDTATHRRPLTGAGKVHRPQRYHREKPRPRRYGHQEEPKKYWSCSFPEEECYRKNLCRPHAACTCHSAKNECESRFRDNCQTDNDCQHTVRLCTARKEKTKDGFVTGPCACVEKRHGRGVCVIKETGCKPSYHIGKEGGCRTKGKGWMYCGHSPNQPRREFCT